LKRVLPEWEIKAKEANVYMQQTYINIVSSVVLTVVVTQMISPMIPREGEDIHDDHHDDHDNDGDHDGDDPADTTLDGGDDGGGLPMHAVIMMFTILVWVPIFINIFMSRKRVSNKINELFGGTSAQGKYEFRFHPGHKHSLPRMGFRMLGGSGDDVEMNVMGAAAAPFAHVQEGGMPIMVNAAMGGAMPMVTQEQMQAQMAAMQARMMQMQQGMGMQQGMMQPRQLGRSPQYGQPAQPTMTQVPIADPVPALQMVESVQVQVPIYGGGGTVMTEYNGHLINVPIPSDATAGSTIMVEVPDMYKISKN